MNDVNLVILQGRIVRNAELKISESGLKLVKFSIATNFSKRNSQTNEWESKVNFFDIALFGDYSENLLPKLCKGQRVIIEGFLKQNVWEKDGEKRYGTEIVAKKLHFIYDKKQALENESEAGLEDDTILDEDENGIF